MQPLNPVSGSIQTMSDPAHHAPVQVLFRREEESWGKFARRIAETEGMAMVVLGPADATLLLQEDSDPVQRKQCAKFLDACVANNSKRIRIATRNAEVLYEARERGLRVFDSPKQLRKALAHHPQRDEALRVFSPNLWRQMWRTRLQSAGLLTLPRVRIISLVLLSVLLFLFVIFRLLPSAEIRVWARGDMATQTTNVLLVQSGATELPSHVRTLPLKAIDIVLHRSLAFDQISKRFTGTNAEVAMTIVNPLPESLSLRKGTRLTNQAGMIFRTLNGITVPAQGSLSVRTRADDLDLYGEVVGERGNVPAGLKWEIPGLLEEDRKRVYAENKSAATGGKTSYTTILQREDVELARKRLERELLAEAKTLVEERIQSVALMAGKEYRLLTQEQLVRSTFSGFVLPLQFLNQQVPSITVEGTLLHRVLAYDAGEILSIVKGELEERVSAEKHMLPGTVDLRHMEMRVFDYADDLSWIKATAELSATEQYILDPLTPSGARFARKVRERVQGLRKEEAQRIINNFPEVEKAEIDLWPPWGTLLPSIPSSIAIVAM